MEIHTINTYITVNTPCINKGIAIMHPTNVSAKAAVSK